MKQKEKKIEQELKKETKEEKRKEKQERINPLQQLQKQKQLLDEFSKYYI